MANYKTYRKFYHIKYAIKEYIKVNKKLLFFGLMCFLLGVATGVISAIRHSSIVEIRHLSDTTLIAFLAKESSIVSLFFARLLSYILTLIIIVLLNSTIFLMPLTYLFIVYKSFISALTLVFLIVLFGFSGFILSLLVILPVMILTYLAFIILLATCTKRCLECRRYNKPYFDKGLITFPINLVLIAFIFLFAACLIELLLLPFMSSFFIIVL